MDNLDQPIIGGTVRTPEPQAPTLEPADAAADPTDPTMRYAADQREKTRQKIVDTAGRVFRERGFDGVGVDGLMRSAELTSGAFYGHFDSKTAIFREVVGIGLGRLRTRILDYQATAPDGWVRALVDFYFGEVHVRNVPGGCALPSLSAEVVRADAGTRELYEELLVEVVALIAAVPPFSEHADGVERAWAFLATLAGGVMLARAVPDAGTAGQILAGVHRAALAIAARPDG